MAKTKVDAKGQMELDNIDTPLGEAADKFLDASYKADRAASDKNSSAELCIDEMRKAGLRTLLFKGKRIRFTPGHKTPDKLSFRETEN